MKKSSLILAAIALAATACTSSPKSSPSTSEQSPGTWKALSAPPVAIERPVVGGQTLDPEAAAVWTGKEVILWGATNAAGNSDATGDTYDPASDSWKPLPPFPLAHRRNSSFVWTGAEAIIWGGDDSDCSSDAPNRSCLSDGAAYNPATGSWRVLPPAPISGRIDHAAVWAGSEMIVWGGFSNDTARAKDGAAYDPSSNKWRVLPPSPLTGRRNPLAVWTGKHLIIAGGWFGQNSSGLDDGAIYDPATGWTRIPDAPLGHTLLNGGVWTGTTMIVWGGRPDVLHHELSAAFPAGGAALDDATRKWSTIPASPNGGRLGSATVWTGTELLAWAGYSSDTGAQSSAGSLYNPVSHTWRTIPDAPFAAIDTPAVGVWTGKAFFAWAGKAGIYIPAT